MAIPGSLFPRPGDPRVQCPSSPQSWSPVSVLEPAISATPRPSLLHVPLPFLKQDCLTGAGLSVWEGCPAPTRALGQGAAWCGLEGTPRLCVRAPPALHFHHFSRALSLATRRPTDPAPTPAHRPSPRAFVFFNLLSEGQHPLFCLHTGTRAHLTPEGRSYCYIGLFMLGCHFARSTLSPPDVSCPSALCLTCVTVTLAEIQQPFVSDSLWLFHAGGNLGGSWGRCCGSGRQKGWWGRVSSQKVSLAQVVPWWAEGRSVSQGLEALSLWPLLAWGSPAQPRKAAQRHSFSTASGI